MTDSLLSLVMDPKSSGSIFFLGRVSWMTPYLSLRAMNEIPPRFLMSCTHPFTVTIPSSALMLDEFLISHMGFPIAPAYLCMRVNQEDIGTSIDPAYVSDRYTNPYCWHIFSYHTSSIGGYIMAQFLPFLWKFI